MKMKNKFENEFANEFEALKSVVVSLDSKVSELMADKQAREDDLLGNEAGQYEDWLMGLDENEAWVIEWNKQHDKY